MIKLTLATLLLTTAVSAYAGANSEAVESLKARAAGENPDKQVELFAKVAELQVKQLSKAYDEGNPEWVEAVLQDIQEYGVKAARSSQETGKRMKKTEITIRKITSRLEDISRTVSYDERQPLAATIKKLDSARSDLLHFMFQKKR